MVGVVSGVALTVLHELAIESLTNAARPWWVRAWRWLAERLRLRRRPKVEPHTDLRALTAEEVPGVVAALTEHAVRAGLPPDQAAQLARAIVAELTPLASADGGPGADPVD
ncbi:hypothetical protein CDO52_19720 [Nocardiopsis gilva YIM 90087]|uniref:Uncharacterized protein n=1 Tax=Nocardiopsis gilva YIM 90087 TaxID=1235441 RepID=A0A223S9H0_9ACTN|nr:hypothetical protein [Nocardiopsis gilva]ASU84732.1 hypothetical protein CDO52_19720 [Nocardiopsis gilva YIM 90087]